MPEGEEQSSSTLMQSIVAVELLKCFLDASHSPITTLPVHLHDQHQFRIYIQYLAYRFSEISLTYKIKLALATQLAS